MSRTRSGADVFAAARAPGPLAERSDMLTAAMERQSCLRSAERWRQQALHVREHAQRAHLRPEQREALLIEAEACNRQADWWLAGADGYVLGDAGIGLEALVR